MLPKTFVRKPPPLAKNDPVDDFLLGGGSTPQESIVQMLGGAHIKIDVTTFQNDMTTIKTRDDVLTLLVHLGYLAYDIDHKSVFIPNEEIGEEFVRAVTTGKHTKNK